MSCKSVIFSGKADCQKLLSKVKGIGLTEKGTTFTDATFISSSTWKTNIADDEPLQANINTLVWGLKAYEKTTDEPEIQTSNLGIKDKTSDPAPSGTFYINATFCDYKTLHRLEGQLFDVVLFLQDGTQLGTRTTGGSLRGFRAVLYTKKDAPESDNAQNSYPVYLFFQNASDFENAVVAHPNHSFEDLVDYIPVGLDMYISTAYTAGDVVVQVKERGTDTGKTGLDQTTDWEVLSSNGEPTVAVTAVSDDGLGQYTITIQQDNDGVPANIASGKWYELQCHDDDGTVLTFLSNTVKETVA